MAIMRTVLTLGLMLSLGAAVAGLAPQAVSAQTSAAPATLRLAVIPVANYTPLVVARDKGFFTEENLNVTWTNVNQGAIAVEAVFGGSVEIGGSSIFEPMVARGNGLDLVFIAASARIRSAPPDNSGVAVRSNDAITSAKDLAGKKISAGLINSVNYVHMREWLQRNGVDPNSVQFLEIPFPQMADALFQNRLDAVWNVEPFLTVMLRTGNARILSYPYQENVPRMDITAYMAKESWVKTNPDVVRRFRRAIDRATTYLVNASKEERDDFVAKYSGMKPELVAAVNLPEYTTEFNVPSLKANLDIAVRQKLAKPFDLDGMIWKP
jgi:ABC-type nitrate/sulfonate/bicarbonate transport system substrate-binding protein